MSKWKQREQERLYVEAMSQSALQRQLARSEGTCPECFGLDGRHHVHCSSWRPPSPESLAVPLDAA